MAPPQIPPVVPPQFAHMDRRLGYDPMMLAQMKYATGAGVNPMMPMATPTADVFGQSVQSTEPGDEYDVADQAKQLNAFQDVMQIMSSPAFHAWFAPQFGGGYSPEDFNPKVTYEPIDMPGRRRLNQALQSGSNTLDYYIASEIQNGADDQTIINGLVMAFNDPDNELHELAVRLMPQEVKRDSGTQGGKAGDTYLQPNTTALERKVTSMYEAYVSDPTPEIDKLTGEEVIDPTTGLPARRIETPSAAQEYFDSIGLANPFKTYDRDAFISPERQAMEEQSLASFLLDQESAATDIGRLRQQLGSSKQMLAQDRSTYDQFQRDLDAYGRQQQSMAMGRAALGGPTTIRGRIAGDPGFNRVEANQDYDAYLRSLGGQETARAESLARDYALAPGALGAAEIAGGDPRLQASIESTLRKRPTTTVTPKQISKRQQGVRDTQKMLTRRLNQSRIAGADAKLAQRAQAMREQQMLDLQKAGYSPYLDQTRASQMALANMFMAPPQV